MEKNQKEIRVDINAFRERLIQIKNELGKIGELMSLMGYLEHISDCEKGIDTCAQGLPWIKTTEYQIKIPAWRIESDKEGNSYIVMDFGEYTLLRLKLNYYGLTFRDTCCWDFWSIFALTLASYDIDMFGILNEIKEAIKNIIKLTSHT